MSIASKTSFDPRQAARALDQLLAQIDFSNEHYYNLYFESASELPEANPAEVAWTNVSQFTADLAKLRGELARLRLGVEQIRMPAIEAVGLDRLAEQLRSLEMKIKPLAQSKAPAAEDSKQRRLLGDLLLVVDTLERVFGLATDVWNSLPKGINTGLESVYQLMVDTLRKHGLTKMAVEAGTVFDPHQHMAMGTEPDADLPAGTVKEVLLAGYVHNEQVIRTAQVVVVKND